MKKIKALLLVNVMLISLVLGISGCGNDSKNTIQLVMMGDVQPRHEEILKKANEIVEPELGLLLEIEYIDSASYSEKSKYKMVSGEEFDVMWAGYANNYRSGVNLGGFMDITDYLDEIEMADGSTTAMNEAVEQYLIDSAAVKGRVYGIPNTQVISNPYTYVLRNSVVEECGIDVEGLNALAEKATDLETVEAYVSKLTSEMQKVKDKRDDLIVVNPGSNVGSRNIYEEIIAGIGIRKDGTSNKIVHIKNTDEFKCGVDAAREWYERGFIRRDIASKGNNLTSTDEEKQHAFVMTSWKPGQATTDAEKYGDEVSYAFVEQPYVSSTASLSTMLVVGRNSKHPEEAVKLIYMLNSNVELYNLLCWGIENEDYIVNDDGTIKEIEDSGYDKVGPSAWKYGNQFNSLILEGQELTVWEDTEKMNNEALKSPAMGFVPDTSELATEISNISNVNAKYKAKIEFGTSPREEYWDQYIAEMKTAGIDTVIEELQKQYDNFLMN